MIGGSGLNGSSWQEALSSGDAARDISFLNDYRHGTLSEEWEGTNPNGSYVFMASMYGVGDDSEQARALASVPVPRLHGTTMEPRRPRQ